MSGSNKPKTLPRSDFTLGKAYEFNRTQNEQGI
jgi:hypothetical protein